MYESGLFFQGGSRVHALKNLGFACGSTCNVTFLPVNVPVKTALCFCKIAESLLDTSRVSDFGNGDSKTIQPILPIRLGSFPATTYTTNCCF